MSLGLYNKNYQALASNQAQQHHNNHNTSKAVQLSQLTAT